MLKSETSASRSIDVKRYTVIGLPVGFPTGLLTGWFIGLPTGLPIGLLIGWPIGLPIGWPIGLHIGCAFRSFADPGLQASHLPPTPVAGYGRKVVDNIA